jgi:hypothetical protein
VTDLKSTVALHGAILDVQQRAIARLLAHLRHRDPTIVQAVLSQMQGDLERHKRRLQDQGLTLDPAALSRFDGTQPERSTREPGSTPQEPREARVDRGSSD